MVWGQKTNQNTNQKTKPVIFAVPIASYYLYVLLQPWVNSGFLWDNSIYSSSLRIAAPSLNGIFFLGSFAWMQWEVLMNFLFPSLTWLNFLGIFCIQDSSLDEPHLFMVPSNFPENWIKIHNIVFPSCLLLSLIFSSQGMFSGPTPLLWLV